MTTQPKGTSTRIIHNRRSHKDCNSPFTPIYNTTNFIFDDTQELLDVIDGKKEGYLYTRWGANPTILELEQGLATIEQAERALAFTAGMAAISSTIFAHGTNGVVCLGDLYGGTQAFLNNHLALLGVKVTYLRYEQIDELSTHLIPGTVLYCETPANPTLRLLDLKALANIAHQRSEEHTSELQSRPHLVCRL